MFNIDFDINLIMVPLLLVLFIIWLLDKFVFKQRKTRGKGEENFIINTAYEFLPILAILIGFRSFLFDYNKIPSGSMEPTLYDGNYILVNKFLYGVRLPLANVKVLPISSPKRGDIVVFRFPEKPSIYYIKRAIGLPGDTISYNKGIVSINGKPLKTIKNADKQVDEYSTVFSESIDNKTHLIRDLNGVTVEQNASFLQKSNPNTLPMNLPQSWTIKVPEGHYFMMGDNRDQSADSRYWGFVPEKNLVGPATHLLFNKKPGSWLPDFTVMGKIH